MIQLVKQKKKSLGFEAGASIFASCLGWGFSESTVPLQEVPACSPRALQLQVGQVHWMCLASSEHVCPETGPVWGVRALMLAFSPPGTEGQSPP